MRAEFEGFMARRLISERVEDAELPTPKRIHCKKSEEGCEGTDATCACTCRTCIPPGYGNLTPEVIDKAVQTSAINRSESRPYWINIDLWSSPVINEPDDEDPIPNGTAHRHSLHLRVTGTSRADAADRLNRAFQSIMDEAMKKGAGG